MKKINLAIIIILMSATLLLAACSNNGADDNSEKTSNTEKAVKAKGGEKLLSVRAEYSYCYPVENPDPTLRSKCETEITYKECEGWQNRTQGSASTFFYATFSGGEPTIPGRTANYYRMKVMYGEEFEKLSDKQSVFKDIESEFMLYDQSGCYPKATIEILNADDEVMGKMSFDYDK